MPHGERACFTSFVCTPQRSGGPIRGLRWPTLSVGRIDTAGETVPNTGFKQMKKTDSRHDRGTKTAFAGGLLMTIMANLLTPVEGWSP